MLANNSFEPAYIESTRRRVAAELAAFDALAATAPGPELAAFEPLFLASLTLALEGHFVHRTRGKEPKNGALKELRARTEAIATGAAGPDRAEFDRLLEASLAELEANFG